MTVIVTVFEAAGLTVSETKGEALLLRTPDQTTLAPLLVTEVVCERYPQTAQLLYLGGIVHETSELSLEIVRPVHIMRAWKVPPGDV